MNEPLSPSAPRSTSRSAMPRPTRWASSITPTTSSGSSSPAPGSARLRLPLCRHRAARLSPDGHRRRGPLSPPGPLRRHGAGHLLVRAPGEPRPALRLRGPQGARNGWRRGSPSTSGSRPRPAAPAAPRRRSANPSSGWPGFQAISKASPGHLSQGRLQCLRARRAARAPGQRDRGCRRAGAAGRARSRPPA